MGPAEEELQAWLEGAAAEVGVAGEGGDTDDGRRRRMERIKRDTALPPVVAGAGGAAPAATAAASARTSEAASAPTPAPASAATPAAAPAPAPAARKGQDAKRDPRAFFAGLMTKDKKKAKRVGAKRKAKEKKAPE